MNVQGQVIITDRDGGRSPSSAWVDALAATTPIEQNPERLLYHLIESRAKIDGSSPALLSDRETYSFVELAARTNAYACWATANGLSKGDRVALMMTNRPEYVACWLGLSKAGVVTALINTNLSGKPLVHCLGAANPAHIIAEQAFEQVCVEATQDWDSSAIRPVLHCYGETRLQLPRLDSALKDIGNRKPEGLPPVTINDVALLIYTSGTTGLPKAAYVSHRRVMNWALWFQGMLGNTEADRMYDCLPLYHSVGGVVAVAATLAAGGSTVIAEKFSARRFWEDVRRWDCTQIQYIGELCRYLLNAPKSEADHIHGLRAAVGNGLRPDIWEAFRSRFNIPQILEFYAATEGNFSLFNAEGKPGAIGRIPSFLRHRFPTAIVKHNADTGEPERNAQGFCIKVESGEAGEAIGRIGDEGAGSGQFEGYTDAAESGRKVLRNVFVVGDRWFRTGDLMRQDAAGYFYFVDRIGETFRWKGENVSTLEVAGVLASVQGIRDAVVYGVEVPEADGKAGMAMLVTDDAFSLDAISHAVANHLPAYARPLFLRIGSSLSVTETFKYRKLDLMKDGFDPSRTTDSVYVYVPSLGGYVLLDQNRYSGICSGNIRI
jgi:fatty-acyl-CoA synthase